MKLPTLFLICSLSSITTVFSQEEPKYYEKESPSSVDTVLVGDLNGDKVIDTAFIFTPPIMDTYNSEGELVDSFGCKDDSCYNLVRFSCKLPEMTVEKSVWGEIENVGDLNGDGISEVLFCNGWFTSVWTNVCLWTIQNGKWELLSGVVIRREDEEPLKQYLISRKGVYYLLGLQYVDDDFVVYEKEVPKF